MNLARRFRDRVKTRTLPLAKVAGVNRPSQPERFAALSDFSRLDAFQVGYGTIQLNNL